MLESMLQAKSSVAMQLPTAAVLHYTITLVSFDAVADYLIKYLSTHMYKQPFIQSVSTICPFS
jgi:hypothetical protein